MGTPLSAITRVSTASLLRSGGVSLGVHPSITLSVAIFLSFLYKHKLPSDLWPVLSVSLLTLTVWHVAKLGVNFCVGCKGWVEISFFCSCTAHCYSTICGKENLRTAWGNIKTHYSKKPFEFWSKRRNLPKIVFGCRKASIYLAKQSTKLQTLDLQDRWRTLGHVCDTMYEKL